MRGKRVNNNIIERNSELKDAKKKEVIIKSEHIGSKVTDCYLWLLVCFKSRLKPQITVCTQSRRPGLKIKKKSRWEGTHCCDEAVEGLSPLRILDCDWTEVVSEPDGGDDPARVAVRNVFLCGTEEGRTNALQMLSELRLARQIDSINTETVNPIMFRNQFRAICTIHYYLSWSLWVITELVSDKSLKSKKWFIKNESWQNKNNERRGWSNVFWVIIRRLQF